MHLCPIEESAEKLVLLSKQGLSNCTLRLLEGRLPPLKNSHAPEEACACDEARAEGIDRDGGSAGSQAVTKLTRKEDVAELGVLSGSNSSGGVCGEDGVGAAKY